MREWEELVTACGDADWRSVEPQVRRRAALVLADTVGAVIAGAARPDGARVVAALAADEAPRTGGAWLPGTNARASASTAAFAYGTVGTWLELDEAAASGVHAGVHVAAAVLAAGQCARVDGARLLDGFLAGYEATAALHERHAPRYPVHPHAGLAAVGAAVGVAVMLGVGVREPARIAATLPVVPVWDACFEGATARHAFAGAAAASAVRAVELAAAGMTGASGALDTLFADVLGGAGGAVTAPCVTRPRLLASTIKQHAACMTCHTAIEAALALTPDDPSSITAVRVWTTADVADKVGRPARANELSGRFSLPYAVATALIRGRSDPTAFTPDPVVAALADRIEVLVDPDLPTRDHAMPARVEVTTRAGTTTRQVPVVDGSAQRPASDEAIREKFRASSGDAALLKRIERIDELEDAGALFAPPPGSEHAHDREHLEEAVRIAVASASDGQHPFGAVVVLDDEVVATGANRALADDDPTAHAEVVALRRAARARGAESLAGSVVYSSSEPCPMCASLATLLGVSRMVFATTTAESAAHGFAMPAAGERLQGAVTADGVAREHAQTTDPMAPFAAFARHQR
ncbi:MAG: MmgE/PrpD family protein [Patulibacter sp.]|nr:MmgE/PrpD family protein [Patulibacter sp.]